MSRNAKRVTGTDTAEPLANQTEPTNQATAVKRRGSARKQKMARNASSTKASKPAARGQAKVEKLRCRYCGSEDLAPSFRKRRDARCRACFKQRHGSGDKKTQAQAKSPARAK